MLFAVKRTGTVPENEKWIMLDPSWDCYFSGETGEILSPVEIRNKIAAGEDMVLNQNAKIEYINYYNYIAKDIFYFECARETMFGTFIKSEQPPDIVYLCPKDYNLTDNIVQRAFYWNTAYDNPLMAEQASLREAEIRNAEYTFATFDSFWGE